VALIESVHDELADFSCEQRVITPSGNDPKIPEG
jgi:hypothetical protein